MRNLNTPVVPRPRCAPSKWRALLALSLTLLVAVATADAHPRHSSSGFVTCTGPTYCVTHFLVAIKGTQHTDWNLTRQRLGAANCYAIPYISGAGAEDISFRGSGLVEAKRIGGELTLGYQPRSNSGPEPGIGWGWALITRSSSLAYDTTPGPCGGTSSTQPIAHGCGSTNEPWDYALTFDASAKTVTLGEFTPAPLTSGVVTSCHLLWTGIKGFDGGALYEGFPVRLSVAQLFHGHGGTIVLHATHTYSSVERPSPYSPAPSGQTTIDWTVTLTRIHHRAFPVAH